MSYDQQNRTNESWNNDPNSFSTTNGPDAGFQNSNQRGELSDNQQQQQFGSQYPTRDSTVTDNYSAVNADPSARRAGFGESGAGHSGAAGGGQGDQLWSAGQGETHGTSGFGRGNTTDADTVGAGGNQFGSTARGAGGVDGDNWRQNDNFDDNNGPGSGAHKASMGDKLKGNAEKLAGRVTGNPSMVERGQVRKSGESEDTNYNANNY
ncbi:hypothetical protein BC628DRAFT_1338750 [Trametes gibbosa]|nr:hypothetical protein BC628DRAFT_1338750 [Trametes gibbosa]